MKNMPTILIADDEPRIRQALSDILLIEGYNVIEAEDGNEVMNKVKSESVDVILLDINMPGKTGIELTHILKSDNNLKHIPVVIVTGQNDHESRIQAHKAGADDFLIKPPHFVELSARVKSLVKVKAYNDYMRNYQKNLERQVAERTIQLQNAITDLKEASLDTIHRLSRAAEYRDEDTSTHIQRMSSYTAALARRAGLSEQDVETILYSSSMHDIGKIGTPDNILLKKGKLSPEEWVIMKEHTVMGAEILKGSSSEFLKRGRIIALTHHEKWNGEGYPEGLEKENIPLEGRISAVADVFDALTTRRPYKEAFPVEEAFSIIREGRGSHFDPNLVDCFLSISDEILSIKDRINEVSNS
ncbi:MAG: response regulator [Spirochaetales bacterium]|nr:response regulator [Spirochaetales bacterium]